MIEVATNLIKQADYLLITAGAGMGVDSGLPDFRGVHGFWRAYPAAKKLGLRFEELANPRWFEKDPKLAWAFYGHRLHLYRDTNPHKGFRLLLEIAQRKKEYFVVTSNVDGQFQKAGFDEMKIDEVHGSIHYLQCIKPCRDDIWSADGVDIQIDTERFLAREPLPKCPYCGAVARPNILMFGDWHWISSREDAQQGRFKNFLHRAKESLVIVEIGAGTAVPTIRLLGEQISQNYNAPLIRINPREAQGATVGLALGGQEAIEKIYEIVQ
ncbi:SIR2 family NAD-dependent protein deacylase [Nitratiruptor sp. SB155-2]|uniref:SIR2 family NAD-dependent protein deacylase n=1 Tax=Nitratiruptor sp. (strain SB155-2) TaxID=387092 RepID=UPI0001586FA0|nr:Sir2 family NAD-dependent protein deacetylase [Nitratiruptor sp. SB155-2]BAF69629.1 transcriptional regulator, Sir2 family [Nitratiruptor sp. SB155-2]